MPPKGFRERLNARRSSGSGGGNGSGGRGTVPGSDPAAVAAAKKELDTKRAALKALRAKRDAETKLAHESRVRVVFLIIFAIVLEIFDLIFEIFKTLWYIALISGSFEKIELDVASVPDMNEMFADVFSNDTLRDIFQEPVRYLRETVAGIEFGEWWKNDFFNWSCPGGVKLVSWAILIVLCALIYVFIAREWLFRLAITSQKYVQRRTMFARILLTGLVRLSLALTFYAAQFLVLISGQIAYEAFRSVNLDTLNSPGDFGELTDPRCNLDYDTELNKAGDYLIVVTLTVVAVWYISLFAGRKPIPVKSIFGTLLMAPLALFIAWPVCTTSDSRVRPFFRRIGYGRWWFNLWFLLIFSLKRILFLTFGIWTGDLTRAFEVLLIAEKFDDDDTDDNNRVEETIQIFGRSRGLLYMLIPGGAVLARAMEVWNDPTVFAISKNLELFTSLWQRAFRWFWITARLALTVLVVFTADRYVLVALLLSLLPPFGLNIVSGLRLAMSKVVDPADISEEELQLRDEVRAARRQVAAGFQGSKDIQGNAAAGLSTINPTRAGAKAPPAKPVKLARKGALMAWDEDGVAGSSSGRSTTSSSTTTYSGTTDTNSRGGSRMRSSDSGSSTDGSGTTATSFGSGSGSSGSSSSSGSDSDGTGDSYDYSGPEEDSTVSSESSGTYV